MPSVFAFKQPHATRARCRTNRTLLSEAANKVTTAEVMPDVGAEVVCQADDCTAAASAEMDITSTVSSVSEASVQCDLLRPIDTRFSVNNFVHNPAVIRYYTGFVDFSHFLLLFQILGPAASNLTYKCTHLEPIDQLFLTLMKLRQAKDDFELGLLFKISETTVASVIKTWINFMYYQFKEINIWPSHSTVQQHMPEGFARMFGNTRVILDATEIPIAKPTDVRAQSCTFSTYKNRNTLKTMVGCTPRGLTCYVSDSYGGSASDRQLIERSTLYKDSDMFDSGDAIMADRGIMVQDLFANKNVHVNTPKMLKGKSRFEPQEIVKDRRIASKRIHVERVIGLSKTFKILKRELPASKRIFGSRIIYICFMISNFRNAIVSGWA